MNRSVAAIAAGLAVLTLGALPANSVTVDDPQTADARSPLVSLSPDSVSAQLVDLAPAVVEPSSRLSTSVTATNHGAETMDDVVLELSLTEWPLADRGALTEFLDDPRSFPTRVAAQQPEPSTDEDEQEEEGEDPPFAGVPIGPGATRTFTIGATPSDLGLPAGSWGVYGAVLTLRTPDGSVDVDAVPLTWSGEPVPPLRLAVVAKAAGTEARLRTMLGASDVPGVTRAVDPTGITNALAFEAGIVARETWRLPSGSPDLTSLAHAGDGTLMELALSQPAGTNLARIDTAPWLAVPAALDAVSVAAAEEHGAGAVLARPGAAGFASLAEDAGGAVADVNGMRVLVPDAELSGALSQYRPGTPAARARVIADSALIAAQSHEQPVLVSLGEGWHPSSPEPTEALEALMAAPWVDPVPLSELIEADAAPVALPDVLDTANDLSVDDVSALAGRLADLTSLASTTSSPEVAIAQWGEELLRGVTETLRRDPGVRAAAVSSALAGADDTLSSLRIAESSDLNLLAASGEIPITVVNRLDHEVEVRADLISFSPNLQVLDSPTVTVAAGQEQVAMVPVEAVSSANVHVAVVLRGADGEPVSDSQSFAVRVRADWGNAATAVFSVLLVLLLIAGLVRTIRRGRRDTRAEPTVAPDIAPDPHSENVLPDEDAPPVDDGDGPAGPAASGDIEPGNSRD